MAQNACGPSLEARVLAVSAPFVAAWCIAAAAVGASPEHGSALADQHGVEMATGPCPESAVAAVVVDPRAWAARCFAVDAGPDAAAPDTLTELRLDIDGDGADELLVGSTVARGNAGGTHFVFRQNAATFHYLGALFLHPQAFAVRRAVGDARPTLWRYRRLGAAEGLLDAVAYDGTAFVATRSERVYPAGEDGARLCGLFESMCETYWLQVRDGEAAGAGDPSEVRGARPALSLALLRSRLAAARARSEAIGKPSCLAFAGEVRAGEAFERPFGSGLAFRLEPTPLGWWVAVREAGRDEDLARLTPPFHFVPNPRELEGWHFRNAANSGPNEGDVNAPGEARGFIFSPEVGRTLAGPSASTRPTSEEIAAVRAAGSGTLWIEDYRLDHLEPGQERAGFAWLRFTVALEWRSASVER
jgi:hypothetical protein